MWWGGVSKAKQRPSHLGPPSMLRGIRILYFGSIEVPRMSDGGEQTKELSAPPFAWEAGGGRAIRRMSFVPGGTFFSFLFTRQSCASFH